MKSYSVIVIFSHIQSHTLLHIYYIQTSLCRQRVGASAFGVAPTPPSTCIPCHNLRICTPNQSLFSHSSHTSSHSLPIHTCALAVVPIYPDDSFVLSLALSIHHDPYTLFPHPSSPHHIHSTFSSNIALSFSFAPSFYLFLPDLHTIQTPSLLSIYHSSFVPRDLSSLALSFQSSISHFSHPSIL